MISGRKIDRWMQSKAFVTISRWNLPWKKASKALDIIRRTKIDRWKKSKAFATLWRWNLLWKKAWKALDIISGRKIDRWMQSKTVVTIWKCNSPSKKAWKALDMIAGRELIAGSNRRPLSLYGGQMCHKKRLQKLLAWLPEESLSLDAAKGLCPYI